MADYKINADSFKFAHVEKEAQEHIATPSLTFTQDAMRRLRKNKVAMISLWIIIIMIVLSVLSIWFSPRNPMTQHLNWNNLPPKLGNLNIPGFNGHAMYQGKMVDMYKMNHVPTELGLRSARIVSAATCSAASWLGPRFPCSSRSWPPSLT